MSSLSASHKSVLFLADNNGSEMNHALRAAAEGALRAAAEGGGRVTTLPKENHGEILEHKDSSYDAVYAETKFPFSDVYFQHILRVLKPGGTLVIKGRKNEPFARALLFGGFTEMHTNSVSGDAVTNSVSGDGDDLNVQWVATRPKFVLGSASLNRSQKITSAPKAKALHAWRLGGDDLAEDDLVDEDGLLENEAMKVEVASTSVNDDCELGAGGGRKACKDCSCGRAEEETLSSGSQSRSRFAATPSGFRGTSQPGGPSQCGSCYLGDAFRCSTCPFLGKPAFKPRDVVRLDLSE